MQKSIRKHAAPAVLLAMLAAAALYARAEVVTDRNLRPSEVMAGTRLATSPVIRATAIDPHY